jgi:hypothetical protein
MFNVSIRECFPILNMSIVCICNTARSKSISLLCTHVDPYKFSTVHPPRGTIIRILGNRPTPVRILFNSKSTTTVDQTYKIAGDKHI